MLNLYDEILIEEVNKVSQEKKDFTFLGLYLANEKNVSALKILNWSVESLNLRESLRL